MCTIHPLRLGYVKIKLMFNWSVDEDYFRKKDPRAYEVWYLLQLINYGLDGEKLSRKKIRKYWPEIENEIFDKDIKKFLKENLWDKKVS